MYLSEIAKERRDLEREQTRAFISGKREEFEPVTSVDVVKIPSSDTIKMINNCLGAIKQARQNPSTRPYRIKYKIVSTEADIINQQLQSPFKNAWQRVLAVFIV